jgi:Protein of unknown function (DUF2892)
MDSNLGPYDQLVRIIIGVAAGWEFLIIPNHWWLVLFSFGFLISGLIGICPIHMLIDGCSNWTRPKSDKSNHCSLQ